MSLQDMIIRLGFAVLCGFLVGLERERHHRPAGIKTHIIVCQGATLISMLQVMMVEDIVAKITADPSLADILKTDYGRLSAQVISGVGFLGAGTIIRTKGSIKGLTTASTLWLIACVGLTVGMGYYTVSALTMTVIMLVLIVIRLAQNCASRTRGVQKLEITISDKHDAMRFIQDYCAAHDIEVRGFKCVESEPDEEKSTIFIFEYQLVLPRFITLEAVIMDLYHNNSILNVAEAGTDA